ncbi:MAG: hypothetical protein HUK20_03830 [Fibrobacter sp.]|nr:hypothetical protein [Fibrobacter sp.]
MKVIKFIAVLVLFGIIIIAGCNLDSKRFMADSGKDVQEPQNIKFENLPEETNLCTAHKEGVIYYEENLNKYLLCKDEAWIEVDPSEYRNIN